MPGCGKGGRVKVKAKFCSREAGSSAGLQFKYIDYLLKKENFTELVGEGAPVYLAGTRAYLATELLELTANAAGDKETLLNPFHKKLWRIGQFVVYTYFTQDQILTNNQAVLSRKKTGK